MKPVKKTPAPVVDAPAPAMNTMAIEWWPIDRPVPYDKNARIVSPRAVDTLAASIKEFGWRQPIVVDVKDVIIMGHTRLLAGKSLKHAQVPVHVATTLSPAQVKALRLMDNRVADETSWDLELVEAEMMELAELHYDTSLTGFTEKEVAALFAGGGLTDPDAVPDVPEKPVSVAGDLWILGEHRVLCGDSTDPEAVARLMGGDKADMVFTDPPYGMSLDTDFSTIKGSLKSLGRQNHTKGNKYDKVIGDHADFTPRLIETVFESFPYCKEIFLWGADYYADLLAERNDGSWLVWDKRKESQAEGIGSEFELCWSRSKHKRRMLRHDWFGFLSSGNMKEASNRVHPTQKPTSLIVDIFQQWGNTGDVVADIFLGSGSTLIACEKTGRTCYGMEMSPDYVDVIISRWEQFTGLQATLQSNGCTFAEVRDSRAEALPLAA